MFIARWQLTTRFGKTDECVAILRNWERDVGQRVGWKPGSVRLYTGHIGAPQTAVEFEVRFDDLNDLQSAWNDLERTPAHKDYLKQLEPLVVDGKSGWTVFRDVDVVPSGD